MKLTFAKTLTALAVSVVLTGCGGSGGSKNAGHYAPATQLEIPKVENAKKAESTQKNGGQSAPNPIPVPTTPNPEVAQGQRVIDLNGYVKGDESNQWNMSLIYYYMPYGVVNTRDVEVDLSKLSGNKLGVHSGKFTHPDLIVKDGTGKNELNYLFVNQPYSSYGILTDSLSGTEYDDRKRYMPFALVSSKFGMEKFKGTANYQGGVIAKIDYVVPVEKEYHWGEKYTTHGYRSEVKQDGTVEINADFDKQRISGYLNSDTVGRVRLTETDLGYTTTGPQFDSSTLEKEGVSAGRYRGKISSNGTDVVGEILLHSGKSKIDGTEYSSYHAVFGGTKQ